MLSLSSSRLLLESISITDGNGLLNDLYQNDCKQNIASNYIASNALKAYLPFYLEQLEVDKEIEGYGPWLIKDRKLRSVVGEISLKGRSQGKSFDIGYYIVPEHRNKAYASEAVSLLCTWAFSQDINKIVATCDKKNVASQKVLYKNGFTLVAKDPPFITFWKREM